MSFHGSKQVLTLAIAASLSQVLFISSAHAAPTQPVLAIQRKRHETPQIGKPYYFGASGLTRWDCSGLTMVAFARAGVSVPHSSEAQINYGRPVSRGSLVPGDLVFFYRGISHVGIYMGNGLIVDAPHPGLNVQVDSLNSMPFAGAVRL